MQPRASSPAGRRADSGEQGEASDSKDSSAGACPALPSPTEHCDAAHAPDLNAVQYYAHRKPGPCSPEGLHTRGELWASCQSSRSGGHVRADEREDSVSCELPAAPLLVGLDTIATISQTRMSIGPLGNGAHITLHSVPCDNLVMHCCVKCGIEAPRI